MKLFEVIASTDFFLFLLGLFGIAAGKKIYKLIKKCNSNTFSYIFVIVMYFIITYISL